VGTYTATITVSGGNSISESFSVSFTVTAVPVYAIALDLTGTHTFPGVFTGYGAQTAKTVTVANTGNQPAGTLSIGKSGANTASFTVSPTSLPGVAVGGTDSFTVAPVTGLPAGTYTATITVSGGNGINAAFDVSFTVDDLILHVTFNAAGGTPATSTAQTSYGGTVSLPANPVRSGYTFSGWHTAANGGGTAFTAATTVTEDITVYAKWLSSNATLAGLSLNSGWLALDTAFSPYTLLYSATVPYTTTSVTVSATEGDFGKASLAFPDGDTVTLNPGANTIRVRVTAEDGTTTRTYTISVTRTPLSANANLGSLTVSAGALSPAFSAATTAYTALVPSGTSSITVTAAVEDTGKATLMVLPSYTVSLVSDSTLITLTVTAEDGTTTKEYAVTVKKTTETNAVNVAITVADERIDLTRSTGNDLSREAGNALRLTAPAGYTNYVWRVDDYDGYYNLISEREIELYAGNYSYGTHSVLLEYEKDGVPYGCEVVVRVVR
jgi:uncharacterized repeat protein (TIGR02543 family)